MLTVSEALIESTTNLLGQIIQRVVNLLVNLLVVEHVMAVRERATLDVLSTKANVCTCKYTHFNHAFTQPPTKTSYSNCLKTRCLLIKNCLHLHSATPFIYFSEKKCKESTTDLLQGESRTRALHQWPNQRCYPDTSACGL